MNRTVVQESSRAGWVRRRVATIPTLFVLFVVAWVLALPAFVLALVIDVVRWLGAGRPFMSLRLVAFFLVYLTSEVVGVAWILLAATRPRPERPTRDPVFRVQQAWAGALFAAARFLFGISLEVEGADHLDGPPYLVLVRHASIVDNLLPTVLIARPLGVHLRHVLKAELLRDPALDLAGNRLPNLFVDREGGQFERSSLGRLAEGMGDDEGIVIFPEGTRFTAERRERAIASLRRSNPVRAERAESREHLLPPRPGGVLALLDATDLDVVVVAHEGLEGFARLSDLWMGAIVDRRVRVRIIRIQKGAIPEDRSGRVDWLDDIWDEVERWIDLQKREEG